MYELIDIWNPGKDHEFILFEIQQISMSNRVYEDHEEHTNQHFIGDR